MFKCCKHLCLGAILWIAGCVAVLAQEGTVPAYVGSAACADCHQDATAAWQGSHHDLAWTTVSPDTVLGDFADTQFDQNSITTRFFKDEDTYMIETDGPTGRITRYPVHSVVGIEPLQQYLIETEEGRLQSFDVVWDTEQSRWYHLYPDQELYAGDSLHWTGPYKNWNARCAECHATDFAKNYDPSTRRYASTQQEIGVGCEACHGPGEAHLAWARDPQTSQTPWTGLTDVGLTIDMSAGGETYIQQCATCHSRREPYADGNPLPGTAYHDAYRLSTLREGIYQADGQIFEEVYVYGSFLQSKMYAQGVTCNDCHTPHSAELRQDGNGTCTQCHSEAGNPRFPTLILQDYDTPEHHFHEAGTTAAQCTSCHMIERDYMVVDGRRDHSFRVPRPDLWRETLANNTCTDCHSDQTPAWAAAALDTWYPNSAHRGAHFGQVIAAGRTNLPGNLDRLADLAEYTALPGIVRATALEMLGDAPDAQIAARLAALLEDPDPFVRAAAASIQFGAPEVARAARLAPLLRDPILSVRISAARQFLNMRLDGVSDETLVALRRAFGDWQQTLIAKTDFPETQLVLAGIALTTRRMEAALRAFGEATYLDPQQIQAWTMIIRIHSALGDRTAALAAADDAIAANPNSVELNLLRSELN